MKRLIATTAILAFVAVSCGGSDNGGAIATPPPTSTSPSPTTSGTGTVVAVSANDTPAYVPATITVKAGTPVQWTVVGSASHTVTTEAGQGDEFDSGNLDSGQKFNHTFTTPGTIKCFCKIHGQASMSGTVTVTP